MSSDTGARLKATLMCFVLHTFFWLLLEAYPLKFYITNMILCLTSSTIILLMIPYPKIAKLMLILMLGFIPSGLSTIFPEFSIFFLLTGVAILLGLIHEQEYGWEVATLTGCHYLGYATGGIYYLVFEEDFKDTQV